MLYNILDNLNSVKSLCNIGEASGIDVEVYNLLNN